jgi:hypothetical protein
MGYSTEEDVYEETGLNSDIVQNLSKKSKAQVTILITKYIDKADKKIQQKLKVPILVRKEFHQFRKNKTVELGPYEDKLQFYGKWVATDNVEDIHSLWLNDSIQIDLPYPRDCDSLTEDVDDMTSTDCTLSREHTIKKCGEASVKAIFLANGYFYLPSESNLNLRIYPWEYLGFWFRSNDTTATFTITFYDVDGNTETATFSSSIANTWEIISFNIQYHFTGSIDWKETELQKIQISSDTACTAYIDNFNFNNAIFWTTPEGLICWSDPDSDPYAQFMVTYSYDPNKKEVPVDINEASAMLAGIKLLDYCIGQRLRLSEFKVMQHDLDKTPDKSDLEIKKNELRRDVDRILADIGYGTDESAGAP